MAKITITIDEVISKVDALKPNNFTPQQKTDWINKVETVIQTQVLDKKPEDLIVYEYDKDHDTELLVALPYSDVYETYLSAMIDFHAGEFSSYQNSMAMFNACLDECVKGVRKLNSKSTQFKNWW